MWWIYHGSSWLIMANSAAHAALRLLQILREVHSILLEARMYHPRASPSTQQAPKAPKVRKACSGSSGHAAACEKAAVSLSCLLAAAGCRQQRGAGTAVAVARNPGWHHVGCSPAPSNNYHHGHSLVILLVNADCHCRRKVRHRRVPTGRHTCSLLPPAACPNPCQQRPPPTPSSGWASDAARPA